MGRKSTAARPYNPAASALLLAQDRAAERAARRDPGSWGVANDTIALPSAGDVEARKSKGRGEIFARRLDVFQTLFARKSLTVAQHGASTRLFRDYCQAMGVKTDDPRPILEFRDPGARPHPSDKITVGMMDARTRYDVALASVGPSSARLLRSLIEPHVACGSVVIWRATVEQLTGETHTHAQAACVRVACEDLRLVYERLDGGRDAVARATPGAPRA